MALYLIPLIAAFIGWFTIWIVIKLLFHPKEPLRFLGYTLQGIFPARQEEIAGRTAAIVAKELNVDRIAAKMKDPAKLKELTPIIETHIDSFLKVKLVEKMPVIATFVGESTLAKLKAGMMEEIESLLPEVISHYSDSISDQVDVEKMVSEKIAALSPAKVEEIMSSSMRKEFQRIKILGAMVGFVMGLVQVAVIVWCS